MLTIQRASAGSGKTYTLARKFIYLFLTTTDYEGGPRRLRHPEELREAHSHILAITFTNKATAEMKERIVEKLAALAADPASYAGGKRPDYMDVFTGPEFGATEEAVAVLARRALSVLLADYSDFNVATIDSFFQNVLRTFAYETDLNDSYEVELDSDYITSVGIDNTLSDVDRSRADSDVSDWIGRLMNEPAYASQWNIFQKKKKTKGKSANVRTAYGDLVRVSADMQKETFKEEREIFDQYFDTCGDYTAIFEAYDSRFKAIFDAKYARWRRASGDWQKAADAWPDLVDKTTQGRLRKNSECAYPDLPVYSYASLLKKGSYLSAKSAKLPGAEIYDAAAMEALNALEDLRNPSPAEKLWKIYRPALLLMGLLRTVRLNMKAFLDDNDVMELSETPLLLQRITQGSDTPFIYERLGTHLNHFLIDEFQDTSRLQWLNLRPLLEQSDSSGGDNLIIGDPKQSIYRFRDADVELITNTVPSDFPGHIVAGHRATENTNHRSERRIVEFNNSFFRTLATQIDSTGTLGLPALYSNVVQPAHNKADVGYIEMHFPESVKDEESKAPEYFAEFPELVQKLRSRGFRMRDIAFLVRRGEEGLAIVNTLIAYNASLPVDAEPIAFVSDESLLISSSDAVQIVVAALQVIKRGTRQYRTDTEATDRRTRAIDIRHTYSFFCSTHPDIEPAERLERFLAEPDHTAPLWKMLARMQSPTLPAMVEAIISEYVPEELRRREAPFLAAFQDAVTDYCDMHAADVGSFLAWWRAKSDTLSITSPADLDAVQILTIHKSKGLEFPCVILPQISEDMSGLTSVRKETIWIKPQQLAADLPPLPPLLNVKVTDLADTPHAQYYNDELRGAIIDALNILYVGFTRAGTELYIYAPIPKQNVANSFYTKALNVLAEMRTAPAAPDMLPGALIKGPEEGPITIGTPHPYTPASGDDASEDPITIGTYAVGATFPSLMFKEDPSEDDKADAPEEDEGLEPPDEPDTDPRSEGNLLHKAMQWIRTPDDVERAVRRLYASGWIRRAQIDHYTKLIADALAKPEVSAWFAPGLRVLAEQAVLRGGYITRRPDRIVVDAEGNAIVIDYKFGSIRKPRRYNRQVRRYMNILRGSGAYKSIGGFIWYVSLGEVVEVERDAP